MPGKTDLNNAMPHTHSRRSALQAAGAGFAYLAFTGTAAEAAAKAEKSSNATKKRLNPLAPHQPHLTPRAKRVIMLFMHGGPSHVDTFDYKPQLQKDDGKELPFKAAERISAKPKLMRSPWKFKQHGESGLWCSELFPHIAQRHIDDLCVIRSMHSKGQSHGQAVSMLHTGTDSLVRPSVGAWVSYGLGTENRDLPSFISISPPAGHGGPRNYGPAFLPTSHQATTIGSSGKLGNAGIANLTSKDITPSEQRKQIELLQAINRDHMVRAKRDENIEGAIESFELAFRMQRVAPEVMNLDAESPQMKELYGVGDKNSNLDNFARQCLLARRFSEAGVRYVQVSTGNVWDQHGGLKAGHEKNAGFTDYPIAGLLTDLKQRGMLDDTLVIWGGEFGRTPIVQGSNGRDHNPQGFCMWLAGAGVKRGFAYGNTDEYGYFARENRVHMHDLHATVLHLLGLDHERLTYRYAGRDFRLTDVYGNVVSDLFA